MKNSRHPYPLENFPDAYVQFSDDSIPLPFVHEADLTKVLRGTDNS